MTPTISIIIPAAGLSQRMGEDNKLLMRFREHATLLGATITAATRIAVDDIVVVTGHESNAVMSIAEQYSVRVVYNPNFKRGIGSSIKAGVTTTHPAHGLMIWPADMPVVSKASFAKVIENGFPDKIVRPIFGDQPGHPVLFGLFFREALLQIEDDKGARSIIDQNVEATQMLEVDDIGVIHDFDTLADLENANRP